MFHFVDIEDESSDEPSGSVNGEGVVHERARVRSRFRHHKTRSNSVPIGIFWDIENCQVNLICYILLRHCLKKISILIMVLILKINKLWFYSCCCF